MITSGRQPLTDLDSHSLAKHRARQLSAAVRAASRSERAMEELENAIRAGSEHPIILESSASQEETKARRPRRLRRAQHGVLSALAVLTLVGMSWGCGGAQTRQELAQERASQQAEEAREQAEAAEEAEEILDDHSIESIESANDIATETPEPTPEENIENQ